MISSLFWLLDGDLVQGGVSLAGYAGIAPYLEGIVGTSQLCLGQAGLAELLQGLAGTSPLLGGACGMIPLADGLDGTD